jgi:3-deoxy-manno-octulosonate cytidylyltransferase (CMP-KDO synthetase)
MSGERTGPAAVAIIPARIGSTRLPRKMLLRETGRCLFEHTYEAVASSRAFVEVVVATDSPEIMEIAARARIPARMTRADHASGTDRVFEAWQALSAERGTAASARVVVNVQGDEPDIAPADLASLVRAFADPSIEIATLAAPIASEDEAMRPSVVKVVCDRDGDALYFSRAALPTRGQARAEVASLPVSAVLRRHIGVYAFTPSALQRFCALPVGSLEAHENLEQLRWLEAGGRMRVVAASHLPHGIDTAEDYARFVTRSRQGTGNSSTDATKARA